MKEMKEMKEMKKEMKMELCLGRHEITDATDGAIFDTQINPLDVAGIELQARNKIQGIDSLVLYVTGLSVALVSVINACRIEGVKLTLMHFDKQSGNYYPQEIYQGKRFYKVTETFSKVTNHSTFDIEEVLCENKPENKSLYDEYHNITVEYFDSEKDAVEEIKRGSCYNIMKKHEIVTRARANHRAYCRGLEQIAEYESDNCTNYYGRECEREQYSERKEKLREEARYHEIMSAFLEKEIRG